MKENDEKHLKEIFTHIDYQMVKTLLLPWTHNDHEKDEKWKWIKILLLMLSRLSQEGQLSLSLAQWSEKKIHPQWSPLPKQKEWEEMLNHFCEETQEKIIKKNEDRLTPILWEKNCLYLNKNHFFQKTIVEQCHQRWATMPKQCNTIQDLGGNTDDEKSQITKRILSQLFTIVNGGPGSGKTTLIFSLIKTAIHHNENIAIKLLAATGKAANRIQQSIHQSLKESVKHEQNCGESLVTAVKNLIEEVETIHRFLNTRTGFIPKSNGSQKVFDLIIIDEASMIAPSLLAQIFLAIGENASLVLLGDRHQLPAVNASNLIEDLLCVMEKKDQQNGVMTLKTSHRYDEHSSIGQIAVKLRQYMDGESTGEQLIETLRDQNLHQKDFQWQCNFFPKDDRHYGLTGKIEKELKKNLMKHYQKLEEKIKKRKRNEKCHHDLFHFFFKKMVLTSHRHGRMGKEAIAHFIKNEIVGEATSFDLKDPYHQGRIVMFLHNDYENQIFNGDIGIILEDEKGSLRFYLYLSDRSLPAHSIQPENMETLYALTIHKSQGSEFDETIVIFSPEKTQETKNLLNNSFLSPNLLYTAITRSKKSSILYLEQETLDQILEQNAQKDRKTTLF